MSDTPSSFPTDRIAALQAAHGRIVILSAGADEARVEFAAKMPSGTRTDKNVPSEWENISADLQAGNADAAELALRRAVVGVTPEETAAERARLEAALDADPPLADAWGMQILQGIGVGAKVETVPAGEGTFTLSAQVGGELVAVTCKRPARPAWKMLRATLVKGGQAAFTAAAWGSLVTSSAAVKAQIEERFPALVPAMGDAAANAGSKAGAAAAPFVPSR